MNHTGNGYNRHQHRLSELSGFGKQLVRRSGAHCELCSAADVPLRIFEVPPVPVEPDITTCIFICDTCRNQLEKPAKIDSNHWHFLTRTVWSQEPAIQVISVRMLQYLESKVDWAEEILEQLYLEPEIVNWVKQENIA